VKWAWQLHTVAVASVEVTLPSLQRPPTDLHQTEKSLQ
jgi:hypothetical protein